MLRTIFLLLAVAAVILAVIWYRTRDRNILRALAGTIGAAAVLLLIVFLVRHFGGKTDHELIVEAVQDMADGVKARDVAHFQRVSDSFHLQDTNKEMFRQFAQARIENGEVNEVRVWDFENSRITPARDGLPATAKIRFHVKPVTPEGATEMFWICEAVFVKDADGQWRLRSFELFPLGKTEPQRIPGL